MIIQLYLLYRTVGKMADLVHTVPFCPNRAHTGDTALRRCHVYKDMKLEGLSVGGHKQSTQEMLINSKGKDLLYVPFPFPARSVTDTWILPFVTFCHVYARS